MSFLTIGYLLHFAISHVANVVAVIILASFFHAIVSYTKRRKKTARLISRRQFERQNNELLLRISLQKTITSEDAKRGRGETEMRWREIRKMKMDALLKCLRDGDVTPLQALRAYQQGALEANSNLNCVVHFFPCAEIRAMELERIVPEERGVLHGLPVSLKECFKVKGCDSTAGLVQHLFRPSAEDCALVGRLRRLGAVPFCHTNVPHRMVSFQTGNPIFGETGNPADPSRECSGTSGGEAALLGAGGSILGVGNDLYGSLRSPAAHCGIVSLRPSFGRHLPSQVPDPLMSSIVGGFMTRDVRDLVTAWRVVWTADDDNDDPEIAPIPWDETRFSSRGPLRIGYYTEDGVVIPHPACRRAVLYAAKNLEKQGHELFRIKPPPINDVIAAFVSLSFCDGGRWMRSTLAHNPFHASSISVRLILPVIRLPKCLQKLLFSLARPFIKFSVPVPHVSGDEIQSAVARGARISRRYHSYLQEHRCDAIVTLGAYYPAPAKGTQGWIPSAMVATLPWSLMDMPAGVVPVSRVTGQDEEEMTNCWPRLDLFYALLRRRLSGGIGLPVAVQVVGRRFDEEIVLRVMAELEEITEMTEECTAREVHDW